MSEPLLLERLRVRLGRTDDGSLFSKDQALIEEVAALQAKLETIGRMESTLASLADCINLELRESGEFYLQIEDYLVADMRPFIERLVDANRKRAI